MILGAGPPTTLLWGLVVIAMFAGCYVTVGGLLDAARAGRVRKRDEMQHDLAIVLFRPGQEGAVAAERLARGPRSILFDLIQRSAADLSGDADARLRSLVASAGLGRRIRRRIHSRSWRSRAQGAALASLLPFGHPDRLALLDDPHALVRSRTVDAMAAPDIAENAERITALLDDPAQAVRLAAKNALLKGGTAIVPALDLYLFSSAGPGTVFALDVAANLPDPRLVIAIEHHALSNDPRRREVAARALGPWASRSTILADLLRDGDDEVRAAAALAIAVGGAQDSVAEVGLLLRDRSWTVRRAAGSALASLGAAGAMTLRVYAHDSDPYAQDMARQTLATIEASPSSLDSSSPAAAVGSGAMP